MSVTLKVNFIIKNIIMAINPESLEGLKWLENIDTTSIDYSNDVMMYGSDYASTMSAIDTWLNIFMLLSFIWMWYGLYVLAKKMNVKNAWMGWVPLLQYYTMTQVAWLDFKKYVLYPILIIIAIAVIWWIWTTVLMLSGLDTWILMVLWTITWIAYIAAYIYYLVRYINILSSTSKRTGRGGWTTFGLFFVPFIMYPVVAYKFKGLKEESKKEEKTIEL